MESFSGSAKRRLLFKKEMLKQELLLFLSIDDLIKFLHLNKFFKSLVEEQFRDNWENLAKLLADFWSFDYSILLKY